MTETGFDPNAGSDPDPAFDLNFPRAWGEPLVRAEFRASPEDFQVDEDLGIEAEGEGEHWLVHIRKRGDNTAWVAAQLARIAGVKVSDVGYCGLKDRHAVTTQWFSIYQPKGGSPDWAGLPSASVEVLSAARHGRKLRRGQHRSNQFAIRLRQLSPLVPDGLELLEQRLETVAAKGAPNYFAEQRFGWEAGNLVRAQALLLKRKPIRDRQQRSMALSAARSWLFNRVLAARVEALNWHQVLPGDPQPVASGPLWGRGRSLAAAETLDIEEQAMASWLPWREGLEHIGLSQERRELTLAPSDFTWQWEEQALSLRFSLPPGTFATALLRELVELWQLNPDQRARATRE